MDPIILLFIFLTVIVLLAWLKQYRLSLILFVIFLVTASLVFFHHIANQLNLNL